MREQESHYTASTCTFPLDRIGRFKFGATITSNLHGQIRRLTHRQSCSFDTQNVGILIRIGDPILICQRENNIFQIIVNLGYQILRATNGLRIQRTERVLHILDIGLPIIVSIPLISRHKSRIVPNLVRIQSGSLIGFRRKLNTQNSRIRRIVLRHLDINRETRLSLRSCQRFEISPCNLRNTTAELVETEYQNGKLLFRFDNPRKILSQIFRNRTALYPALARPVYNTPIKIDTLQQSLNNQ